MKAQGYNNGFQGLLTLLKWGTACSEGNQVNYFNSSKQDYHFDAFYVNLGAPLSKENVLWKTSPSLVAILRALAIKF